MNNELYNIIVIERSHRAERKMAALGMTFPLEAE